MNLRTRVAIAVGAVVFAALGVVAAVIYPAVGANLRSQADASLLQVAGQAPTIAAKLKQTRTSPGQLVPFGDTQLQIVPASEVGPTKGFVGITGHDVQVADGNDKPYFHDEAYGGVVYRIYTMQFAGNRGVLVRVAQPVSLRYELDCRLTLVRGDPDALERAIGNLVDNALKWSPPDGHIRISAAGGTVEVSDDGPGIPADDLPYIFDRFYRSATARALPGSGLGLAIVRRITDMHGGTVEAIPQQQGVTFRITVPEIATDPATAEPTRYAADHPGLGGCDG